MAVDFMEPEEERPRSYRPYTPQSFDDAGGAAAGGDPHDADAGGDDAPDARMFIEAYGDTAASGAPFEPHESAARDEEAPDFASIKFQRENTLLTNAENYAASIREEAELYVKQLRAEAEALDGETQARYDEARRVKEEAEAEAARIVAEAEAQADEVRQQAYAEGHDEGLEAGRREGYEAATPYLERLEAILAEAAQFRQKLAFYTEKDGIRLALLMAKKVLRAELKLNKQAILKLLAATLSDLQGTGTFRVWLNPEDHKFAVTARPSLERFLDEDQALTLRAKPDLGPGNLLIETDREVIDLTFQSQFYHLERLLNQTLAERETELAQRAARTAAAKGAASGRTAPARQAPAAPAPEKSDG